MAQILPFAVAAIHPVGLVTAREIVIDEGSVTDTVATAGQRFASRTLSVYTFAPIPLNEEVNKPPGVHV